MRNRVTVFIFATLMLVAVVAGMAVAKRRQQIAAAHPFKPYTVTYTVTQYDQTGHAIYVTNQTRYHASSGSWHDITTLPNGKQVESFGEPGRGAFQVKGEQLAYISGAGTQPQSLTIEDYRSSPQYVRDDVVLGVPVVVLRNVEAPGQIGEMWIAPSIDCALLKTVMTTQDLTVVREPLSIAFGEPDSAAMAHPEKPVEYQDYERLHGAQVPSP